MRTDTKRRTYRKPKRRERRVVYRHRSTRRRSHPLRTIAIVLAVVVTLMSAGILSLSAVKHMSIQAAFRYSANIFLDNSPLWQESAPVEEDEAVGGDGTAAAGTSDDIPDDAPFELTVLDVGQGLSVLIESDGHYMMYDGGNRDHSSYVVAYLSAHGISSLDYMFASHYDEDHIAGLVGVLNTTQVSTVVDPDYMADSKIYQSFCSKLAENGAAEEHPYVGQAYYLGNAAIQVLNTSLGYGNENDNSVAVRISYGDFSVMITGDAEEAAENTMLSSGLDLDSDVYIVGHHGSSSSSSLPFLLAVSPTYSLISVGAGNTYGHPAAETISSLMLTGSSVYRTDQVGEITVLSDGEKVWIRTAE